MKPTKIVALGGVQEIGKATLLVEQEDNILLIDAGIKFADMFSTGVKGIIPDYFYLNTPGKKPLGIIITHGHEDHIGGVVYALKQTSINRIIAPRIAISYLKLKMQEHGIRREIEFIELDKNTDFNLGPFRIDVWTAQHSIPDAFGIRLTTENGSIMCTGDFRFDYRPIGNLTDFTKLKQIGDEGLTVLLSDSTNAMRPYHSPSELDILFDIEKYMRSAEKKIIVTAFASNLTRMKAIINLGIKLKKKICIFGRSMVNSVDIGRKLNYIDVPDDLFINKKQINDYNDNELLIITTGSQGEELAALAKMSNNKHPQVQIKNKDLILFSSSPIPGNRIKIELLINKLCKLGAIVKENGVDGYLHTSGHAYKDEHAKIFQLTKPKYFLPYHGEYRMSVVHGESAVNNGVNKKNVMIPKLGVPFYMINNNLMEADNERINVGPIYIDGNTALESDSKVLNERHRLGNNGFVYIILSIDKKNNSIVGKPSLVSRGTFYTKNNEDVINEAKKIAHGAVLYTIKNTNDWDVIKLKALIIQRLQAFFYKQKRRNPIIVPVILFTENEISEEINQLSVELIEKGKEKVIEKEKAVKTFSAAQQKILASLKQEMIYDNPDGDFDDEDEDDLRDLHEYDEDDI
ncbi:ribonuclease J [Mycoplasma phocimorsus]|uniref:ribonuclease J n=1 Tax=Mycoplasma phocimorsus TaxID=3045839 RepID=UPI0024BF43FB|nr:ribonuclease J [Mycoplasma phocimorsus]MDJ1648371.1 ribonuclease J [Mycoplasma phocimorsus]